MIRSLRIVPFVALLAVVGGGCAPQDEGIELQLFTATYDTAPEAPPPEGWQRVSFEGNLRSRPVAVLVSDEPLLTGWNIVALRVAEETDGSRAISIRLNAYGQQKMKAYGADEARLKAPLALRIDERWADVSPLLSTATDRMTLYGLTAKEAERLEQWIEVR